MRTLGAAHSKAATSQRSRRTSISTMHSALSRWTSPLQSASKRSAVTPLWLYLGWVGWRHEREGWQERRHTVAVRPAKSAAGREEHKSGATRSGACTRQRAKAPQRELARAAPAPRSAPSAASPQQPYTWLRQLQAAARGRSKPHCGRARRRAPPRPAVALATSRGMAAATRGADRCGREGRPAPPGDGVLDARDVVLSNEGPPNVARREAVG